MTEAYANASSQHESGKHAAAGLHAARSIVAEVFGVAAEEVIFTSGGTESNNLAIKGVASMSPRGRHIITSAIEHEAVLESCRYLERFHGFEITTLDVDHEGRVDVESLRSSLRDDTTLCSIQYANNEVGTVQDITALAKTCSDAGVPFHTDAVQAAGLLALDAHAVPAPLVTISAHKFGGPKGVGALVKRSSVFIEPLVHGGGQEFGLRSGTSNVAGVVGLASALHRAESQRTANVTRLTTLREALIHGIQQNRPEAILTGSRTQRLAHHASFCFPGTSGESVLLDLEASGIACSSGSACAAGKQEPSSALLAMGYSAETAETAVRFTLGSNNTEADVETVVHWFAGSS
jgi:cysteine desulfurase